MKAGEVVFEELLNGKIQYRVPLFQRTYDWSEDQWSQLWDDLLEIHTMDSPRKHFIGSVVTQQMSSSPEGVSRYMLIDGQQRMTTLFILLAVIGHRAKCSVLAQEIEESYLTNKFAKCEDERRKLLPTEQDRQAFKSALDGSKPPVETRIGEAWEYFEEALDEEETDGHKVDLAKLKDCIVNYLDMVSIRLEQDDSPNRIFESLNNTGLQLSVSDLIRNYLLMNIPDPEEQEKAYKDYWYPMQQRLRDEKQDYLGDFFWRYLMMDGGLHRRDETFDGVRDMLRGGPAEKGDPTKEKTVAELERYSKFSHYYAQLVERPSPKLSKSLKEQIGRLNQWEVDVAYPFLMQGLDKVDSETISRKQLLKVMRMIESFVVRRGVCGVPTNRLRRIFAQMAAQIHSENYVESARLHLERNRWPADEEFRREFVRFQLYVPSRLKRTMLVLKSLDASFGDKETPEFTDGITIEHIMPQSLSDGWKTRLGINAKETHDQWLHTVGNLTLTGYNSDLGNKSFPYKKKKLRNSKFALSSAIQEFDEWNERAITTRGNELAKRALEIWER